MTPFHEKVFFGFTTLVGTALGMSAADIDQLFIAAEAIEI